MPTLCIRIGYICVKKEMKSLTDLQLLKVMVLMKSAMNMDSKDYALCGGEVRTYCTAEALWLF